MDETTCLEQVAGILVRAGLPFATRPDGGGYAVPLGEEMVFVEVEPSGEGSVLVRVECPVLQEIDPEGPGGAAALNVVHELNLDHSFVKFTFDYGALVATYELLGDHLRSEELMHAIFRVGAASCIAAALAEETGGKRYAEVAAGWDDD
ncbi:MAG TPA: hypothetical protein VM266_08765 [Solirubrobacteraceae bacterium]|nr:hypothetical protein [Solirubrobacteraceae bacterium]